MHSAASRTGDGGEKYLGHNKKSGATAEAMTPFHGKSETMVCGNPWFAYSTSAPLLLTSMLVFIAHLESNAYHSPPISRQQSWIA